MFPESHLDLLRDDVRAFALLATIMQDGSPQATPIWFSWDGEYILINSVIGRIKDRNMRRHPNIAMAILDPNSPYRYVQVRGVVMNITSEGGVEHISALSQKYRGRAFYAPGQPTENRVIYRIKPEHISASG